MPSAVLLVPGRFETLTGGYGYDRRIVAGLRQAGWSVDVRELDDSFPHPTDAARQRAGHVLASIPDGTLVIVDGLAFGALPGEAAAHAARLRLVALVHHPLAAETGLAAADAERLRESERRALAAARTVIVTSAATARLLAAYDVGADRVAVVNPGTDPAPAARGSGGPYLELLCVATLIPRKGHDVLFQALSNLAPESRNYLPGNWRLTCIGSLDRDRATVERLRAQLAASGLAPRVALSGEKEAAALAECYDRSDLFVLPTLYEGFGMAVAEALAHGLPVVATRTGAIPELVSSDAGILVAPGDADALARALAAVLGDSALRERLTRGARAARRRLPTWDHAVARMAAVLESVAA